jgi:hypothetical protein
MKWTPKTVKIAIALGIIAGALGFILYKKSKKEKDISELTDILDSGKGETGAAADARRVEAIKKDRAWTTNYWVQLGIKAPTAFTNDELGKVSLRLLTAIKKGDEKEIDNIFKNTIKSKGRLSQLSWEFNRAWKYDLYTKLAEIGSKDVQVIYNMVAGFPVV